jgi:hypothetical protein
VRMRMGLIRWRLGSGDGRTREIRGLNGDDEVNLLLFLAGLRCLVVCDMIPSKIHIYIL